MKGRKRTATEALLFLNTLDSGGLAAGAILSALLILSGVRYLALLLVFFVLAAVFTKLGSKRKGNHRPRGWRNVLANGIFPTFAAVVGSPQLFVGALSAVTADKLAGEIGQLSDRKPILITDWETQVPRGTNGGITLLGESSAVLAGSVIGAVSFVLLGRFAPPLYLFAGVVSGFLGANFDSILGAVFENRGLLDKHGVNFLASVFGGIVSLAIFRFFL
ncbi:MAG: DUF92 domain-containing protein [archaeon]